MSEEFITNQEIESTDDEAAVDEESSTFQSGKKTIFHDIEKERKLEQKTRYLQFFSDYKLTSQPPNSWKCSACLEVSEKVLKVTYTCRNKRGQLNTVCNHKTRHTKETWEQEKKIKCDDRETHTKEWEKEEKGKYEVRNLIRKEFNKEEGKGKKDDRRKSRKSDENIATNDIAVDIKPKKKDVVHAKYEKYPEVINYTDVSKVEKPVLIHGENCSTCVRMEKLMGQVLPHPANIIDSC